MNRNYDIIVVGGGLAGLTASAYLSENKINNLLIEKEDRLGGLVNSFTRNGFTFDSGIRSLENQGILFPFLKNFNIDLDLKKTRVTIGFKDEFIKLDSYKKLDDYFQILKNLFPENKKDIKKISKDIKDICRYQGIIGEIDNPLLMKEEDLKNLKFLFKTLMPWLFKQGKYSKKLEKYTGSIEDYLGKLTDNQSLIDMISQHFFKNTPVTFALSYFNMYLDYYYPKEGTGELPKALENTINELGGEILKSEKVIEVDNINNEIKTETEKIFKYNKLIWAADQKTLYEILKDKDLELIKEKKKIISKNKGTDSILTLWLGTDLRKEELENNLGEHSFYTPKKIGISSIEDWRDIEEKTEENIYNWLEKYLGLTTFEVSNPGMRSEKLAPEGKMGMIISTLLDYELVKYIADNFEYEKFKDFVAKKIISIFEENLFPKFSRRVLFNIVGTPLTIEKFTGNYQGSISSWEFSSEMPSESDFKKMAEVIYTGFDDIYQCGQWTFSPGGIPVSILTGKLAADEILKEKSKIIDL